MAAPLLVSLTATAGSEWDETFTLLNEDDTRLDLTNATLRFVIRPTPADETTPALIHVDSTGANSQGYISIDTSRAQAQVVLYATTTLLLGEGDYAHSLWLNPDQPNASLEVRGPFYSHLVAQP